MRTKGVVWIVVCTAFAFLSVAPPTFAEESPQAAFYRQCIQEKITQCAQKANVLAACKSTNMRDQGVKVKEQADFFQLNLDRLVQEMVDQNVASKKYKVSYFLNTVYAKSAGSVSSN